jgi:phosphatidylserine/phosphatidylglycerophosphate/cardiolipin synthase-like enzyme
MKTLRPVSVLVLSLAIVLPTLGLSCAQEIDPADMEQGAQPRVRGYFNNTGTSNKNGYDHESDDMLIQGLDRAESTIDFAVMGFSRRPVIDALIRAHHRGVRLRFVGDARHYEYGQSGYVEMEKLNIPMISGNLFHIMHDKFFIIDDRHIVTGTGNITPTGYDRNANNYVFIDSPSVAADFKAEFEQMFEGRFSTAKHRLANGTHYEVGDTTVEVYFSPQEDTMGRILEHMKNAQHSIHFMIFAFTKDQVGSGFISKHLEFTKYNECCGPGGGGDGCELVTCEEPFEPKEVRGVVDKSQLHSNGPYHEAYRLLMFDVPMRLDGSDNSYLPGDYQAGGGRMHSKTMVIDAGYPTAKVITGSFNWSSSATQANDETLLILHGERVAKGTKDWFETHWTRGKRFGFEKGFNPETGESCKIEPGDVIFNEIHWDGWNGDIDPTDFGTRPEYVSNDEFIELLNTTNCAIDLSMWVIASDDDFVTGLYPGTIIGPHERFLLVDHNLAPFVEAQPHDQSSAFQNADFVMNTANDARFLRLNLHNAKFRLQLLSPRHGVMDVAGNGGPPFYGGLGGDKDDPQSVNFSMERVHPVERGDRSGSWQRCKLREGGENVVDRYRRKIIATPGEANSENGYAKAEPEDFRRGQPPSTGEEAAGE